MDDATYDLLSDIRPEKVILIKLQEIELQYPELLDVKGSRSTIEYYFTCSPVLPLYILESHEKVDRITYLDADIYFFSGVKELFAEISDSSIAIVEHRFKLMKKRNLRYGRYNVGILSFMRDEEGLMCLRMWKDECIDWCYDRLEDGKFADQKYLDRWPGKYQGLSVIQNKGVNLAPWNIRGSLLSLNASNIVVDDNVLVFYHFHGLKKIGFHCWDSGLGSNLVRCSGILRDVIYKPYICKLSQIESDLLSKHEFIATNNKIRPPISESLFARLSYKIQYIIRILLGNYIKI